MRRGMMIAGIVVLVIGIGVAGFGFYENYAPASNSGLAGSILTWTPPGLGPFSTTVSWSGGSSSTVIYVSTDQPTTCSSAPPGEVATGTGGSGSVSFSATGGTQYFLVACPASLTTSVSFSVSSIGLSYIILIGIVVAVIGIIIAVLGIRKAKKAAAMAPPPPPPPAMPPAP